MDYPPRTFSHLWAAAVATPKANTATTGELCRSVADLPVTDQNNPDLGAALAGQVGALLT